MDISRNGETIRLQFEDDERESVALLAFAARPVIESRCSPAAKAIIASQGELVQTTGELQTGVEGYQRLRDIARVALMTPHTPTRELLARPHYAASLVAIKQLYATDTEQLR